LGGFIQALLRESVDLRVSRFALRVEAATYCARPSSFFLLFRPPLSARQRAACSPRCRPADEDDRGQNPVGECRLRDRLGVSASAYDRSCIREATVQEDYEANRGNPPMEWVTDRSRVN